jgi:hypothetical protein
VYRRFTNEDQLAFARLSGDFNPVHVDPVAARRSMFGQSIVHGVHSALWAMDAWCEAQRGQCSLASLKVEFVRPVGVGESISYRVCDAADGRYHVEIHGKRSLAVKIAFTVRDRGDPAQATSLSIDQFPPAAVPRQLTLEDVLTAGGSTGLFLQRAEARKLFPRLANVLPLDQVAVLVSTSRIVGVDCPGMHSLYSSLAMEFEEAAAQRPELAYSVAKVDRRFGLVQLRIDTSNASGRIDAFVRPPPIDQPSCAELRSAVGANEFASQRALVIGGSRGLGEVAAKLLAAGGAHVCITYHRGEADARRVADDISAAGARAKLAPHDVLRPSWTDLDAAIDWLPTHCYYFATPFIFSGVAGVFSDELFNRFSAYYVTGFIALVDHYRQLGVRAFFYPSSTAIDELPQNMGEYAAAKAAGEIACRVVEQSQAGLRIDRPRFPRAATDQTVSVLPVKNHDPVPLILEHLRRFA